MEKDYVFVYRDKYGKVVDKTNFRDADQRQAKTFFSMLMHQKGVRTGQMFEVISDIGLTNLIDESEIYHYGE